MTLRPYKFLVMPVVQEVDEEGVVLNEQQPQAPDVVFGIEGLRHYADGFETALELKVIAAMDGGPDDPR